MLIKTHIRLIESLKYLKYIYTSLEIGREKLGKQ